MIERHVECRIRCEEEIEEGGVVLERALEAVVLLSSKANYVLKVDCLSNVATAVSSDSRSSIVCDKASPTGGSKDKALTCRI